jgi:cytochrome c
VKYILTLGDKKEGKSLPLAATMNLKDHKTSDATGWYVLTASYTDKGAMPLTNSSVVMLRPSRFQVEDSDRIRNASLNWSGRELGSIHHKSYFMLKNVDLKNIKSVTYKYKSKEISARIEIHTGSAEGPIISTIEYPATGDWDTWKEISAPVKDPGGKNDLYFVFRKETEPHMHMASIDWVEFKK